MIAAFSTDTERKYLIFIYFTKSVAKNLFYLRHDGGEGGDSALEAITLDLLTSLKLNRSSAA